MWSNGIKSKYMFMFPLKKLARKELNLVLMTWISNFHVLYIRSPYFNPVTILMTLAVNSKRLTENLIASILLAYVH